MTVAKASVLVLDCAEPEALAEFCASLLDAEIQVVSDPDFVELVGHNGVHVAIRLDGAEREAVSLGVVPIDTKDCRGPCGVRFHPDLAGHSFSFAVSLRNEPPGRGREHHEAA
ncbi:VOC family protein [Streptomyces sp. NBC_00154]|uniref:VOC family protein n=1 Tax=Streptomyces sp. NBC_00154 TaxID=2975670 RepID=UPI002257C447|nr:VOC family protein [Streptomyces sp. NBC_00154]MCX5317443.1 VOC family protein [Streptomyces sp. NBC_00154]